VLLVLVLAIWGIIGYRIVSTIKPKAPNISQQNMDVAFNPNINTKIETFSIQLMDRDPFLGTLYNKKPSPSSTKHKSTPPIIWPGITFQGIISKQNSKEKICILSINGQQHIMKAGKVIEGIKLLKINKKDILVSYKGQSKIIVKQ
jgi:type II secretory pathway component PulC